MKFGDKNQQSRWYRHGGKVLVSALLFSLVVHVLSGLELGWYQKRHAGENMPTMPRNGVKVRIIDAPKLAKKKDEPKKEEKKAAEDFLKKILEMPQAPTEAPKEADHVGIVNHQTKKETRVSDRILREKAKDAGQKGKPEANNKPKIADAKPVKDVKPPQPPPPPPTPNGDQKPQAGSLAMGEAKPKKPRNDYEALLPSSMDDLNGQLNAGYQDYVDDKILEGDRIDINTSEYRFIGYFTNLRKAIELVWNYPIEASRRGMQGEVGLEFTIAKDGSTSKIRVMKSSGYEILDKAIVDAIKLASPFAPLPDGFSKNKITVTGSFRYILTAFGSH